MKRVLCLLCLFSALTLQAQDFVTKFLECFPDDGNLHCQTIGPKMMEKLVEMPGSHAEDGQTEMPVGYLLSKLKSARIVTADTGSRKYYDRARLLLEQNRNRFKPLAEDSVERRNAIYVRRHKDVILELVLLSRTVGDSALTIVNLTGEMDDRFLERLSGNGR